MERSIGLAETYYMLVHIIFIHAEPTTKAEKTALSYLRLLNCHIFVC